MIKHEIKKCMRCGHSFECKVGSIHLCQCTTVALTEEERQYVKEKYDDCICASCLATEKDLFLKSKFEQTLKKISGQF